MNINMFGNYLRGVFLEDKETNGLKPFLSVPGLSAVITSYISHGIPT